MAPMEAYTLHSEGMAALVDNMHANVRLDTRNTGVHLHYFDHTSSWTKMDNIMVAMDIVHSQLQPQWLPIFIQEGVWSKLVMHAQRWCKHTSVLRLSA